MCGKIQHTTTFVSVYLLTLFIVSDFVQRRAWFRSDLQWAFAMIPATLLRDFSTQILTNTLENDGSFLLEHVVNRLLMNSWICGV